MNDRNPKAKACVRKYGPDCAYLTSALSYWCTHKECIKERGTSIPGIMNCKYYKPHTLNTYVIIASVVASVAVCALVVIVLLMKIVI